MEKLKSSFTASGTVKWFSCSGGKFGCLQKVKLRISMWSYSSTPRYILKKTENISSHKNLYMNIHILSAIR